MRIGNITVPHGLFLAPMAGFSDRGMRAVCREWGAEYTVTEMVSAKAVCYGDRKTAALALIPPGDGPCALQLFGAEPQTLAEAARRMQAGLPGGIPPAAIDINMGCPVPKVFRNGEGSALMRSPERIFEVVRAVSQATPLPVTVKLRLGADDACRNAPECAAACEEGGACCVFVHGRTRPQMYAGAVDRAGIAAVCRAVRIPVIANGDIRTGGDALTMLKETGAAGVMVGRGAVGNPFIFAEIRAAIEGKPYPPPDLATRKQTALQQLSLSVSYKGETVAVREARPQIAAYLSGFRGAAACRARIMAASTYAQVEEILREF